jgi:hypothetical protein
MPESALALCPFSRVSPVQGRVETHLRSDEMKVVSIELDYKHEVDWQSFDGVRFGFEDGTSFFFGISDSQSCCENWGYLHAQDDVSAHIGATWLKWEETNTWPFETEKPEYGFDEGGFQAINVFTSAGLLQFVVYNAHNGYYGHSVIAKMGKQTVLDTAV